MRPKLTRLLLWAGAAVGIPRATTLHEPRDSSGSTDRATGARAARGQRRRNDLRRGLPASFPGRTAFSRTARHLNMVLAAGTMSLVATGLLFLLSAIRRAQRPWWVIVIAVDTYPGGRLGAAVAAIGMWNEDGELASALWGFLVVPLVRAAGVGRAGRDDARDAALEAAVDAPPQSRGLMPALRAQSRRATAG